MKHVTLLIAALLLTTQHTAEANLVDTAVNYVANRVLGSFVLGASAVQPAIFKVVDAVAAKRAKRGDKEGAARVKALRQWFNFLGVRKGFPAIAVQLMGHRGALSDAWGVVTGAIRSYQQRASEVGPVKAWQDQSSDISKVSGVVVSKLMTAVTAGPTRAFFQDLKVELQSDNIASDVLEEVLPDKEQRQQMLHSLQQYFNMLRTAVDEGLNKTSGKPGLDGKTAHGSAGEL